VLEYAGAFLQLYREEGWYLERTVHYIGRVGLDHVKRSILENSGNRKALHERLLFSLNGEPDPWHEPEKSAGRHASVRAAGAVIVHIMRPDRPERNDHETLSDRCDDGLGLGHHNRRRLHAARVFYPGRTNQDCLF
jgi:hypothetical protein